jgi:hypothetical protein
MAGTYEVGTDGVVSGVGGAGPVGTNGGAHEGNGNEIRVQTRAGRGSVDTSIYRGGNVSTVSMNGRRGV